jgi:1-acyl-sn-glycerol-3-phosphate acyltransferase
MSYKSVFSLTPGKNRAIFLEEIPVEGLTQQDLPALKKQVYDLMNTKLREYKASWIKNP